MTKSEFISYISKDNSGYHKTRQSHIKKVAPNILNDIDHHVKFNKLTPINFNDSLNYFLKDITKQSKCLICNKVIGHNSSYCSNTCKKKDIYSIISKTHKTLLERTGSSSPLGSEEAMNKRKKTCVERYGFEHPSKNKITKDKIQVKNKKTWEDEKIRNKVSIALKNAYDKNKESILHKRKFFNLHNYGEYSLLPTRIIEKTKETLIKKYGLDNPFKIHDDTYKKARLGSIKFFSDETNKNMSIEKRIQTINKKYGSLDKMNEMVFNKRKDKIISDLKEFGVKDQIIEYSYNKLSFIKCKCSLCDKVYELSFRLLRERVERNDICCIYCSPPLTKWVSNSKNELFNWLSKHIECEQNNRKLLERKEIDVYVPKKQVAIEFNGIYWHSDLYKDKDYHLNKTLFLKNKNIELVHVWEDLWEGKKEIVKGRILAKLNLGMKNIGARKCSLKEISSKEASYFYENNHLQGKTKSSINVALFYENEIISSISISKRKLGKNKKDKNNYEVLRFCNKIGINCLGSFSKLFKYIVQKYPGNYISYADLSWGEGNVYKHAGFKLREYSKPNYWYFIENKRYHRYNFNKQRLIKLGYDGNKTEFQIMDGDIKALRVYDCGNAVWEFRHDDIYKNE